METKQANLNVEFTNSMLALPVDIKYSAFSPLANQIASSAAMSQIAATKNETITMMVLKDGMYKIEDDKHVFVRNLTPKELGIMAATLPPYEQTR